MINSSQLIINDMQIALLRSARRKTIAIEVDAEGIKVRAPARLSEKKISQFVLANEAWIQRHLAKAPVSAPAIELIDGAEIMLRGTPHQLRLLRQRRGKGRLRDHIIELPLIQSQLSIEESARRKLHQFLRQSALNDMRQRVRHFAPLMFLNPRKRTPSCSVRSYTRRWGSCAADGRLSFNWRLIQAPDTVIDYVVVHELAHLLEFNHSQRFWTLVEQQLPDWKNQREWLNRHGATLYRF
ncbi:MAG: M48 family metallopeptidase [Gammaproteobacteria bacterium]|nr:M48 family metallopeptidase [Gammaproteobacteria bacterium]